MRNKNLVDLAPNGEFIYHPLNTQIPQKYKPDNVLDRAVVPYLVMLLCLAVDAAIFVNLFTIISFDSPLLIVLEVSCFLFAFDILPIYLGIHFRRLKQKLVTERFILWIGIAVFSLAAAMNLVLRVTTIDQMAPESSFHAASSQSEAEEEVDSTAIALTVFCIGGPLLTSVGSFTISYLCYNPLQIRKRREETLIAEKTDEIRRLNAYQLEYEAAANYGKDLMRDDELKYQDMQRMYKAKVMSYSDYVRQRLIEHIGDPTSTNRLSQERTIAILDRLDREIAALYSQPTLHWQSQETDQTRTVLPMTPPASNDVIAQNEEGHV